MSKKSQVITKRVLKRGVTRAAKANVAVGAHDTYSKAGTPAVGPRIAKTARVRVGTQMEVPTFLQIKARGVNDLIGQIKQGFDYRSLERFIEKTQLSKEDAIRLVQISPRTMHRRKEAGRLSPEESDRLVRAARVMSRARRLFENDEKATNRWLSTPQPALAGATPLEYATTELGAREVEALINRLEHGVFS